MNEEEKKLITLNPDDYYDEQVFNKNFEYLDEKIIELDQNKAKLIDGKVPLSQLTIDTELSQDSQAPIGNRFLKIVIDKKADLNENGKIPEEQLPSYVDDVVEYDTYADFPEEGETGKIYVDVETNTTYRWSGSMYVRIGKSYDEDIERIDESIKAIKGTAEGQFIYDNDEKMTKVVPDGVNKGIVAMIGGKTVKINQLIDSTGKSITPTAQYAATYESVKNISDNNKHIYYVSMFLNGGVNVLLGYGYWTGGSANKVIARNVSTTTPTKYSLVFTNDITPTSRYVYAIEMASSGFKTITLSDIMLIDLTETFGAGKEPTLEQCDVMFPDYIPYSNGHLWNAPIRNVALKIPDTKTLNRIGTANINSNGSISELSNNDIITYPVKMGETYLFDKGEDDTVYAFYNALPIKGSVSYNQSRTVSDQTGLVEVVAPINGYLAFRTVKGYSAKVYNKTTLLLDKIVDKLPDYGCSAGDVYNYVDFEEMVYHHRVGSIDMSTLKDTGPSGDYFYAVDLVSVKKSGNYNLLCSKYNTTSEVVTADMVNMEIKGNANNGNIYWKDDKYTSITDLKGVILNYELAEEELIPLTDILMPFMLESGGTITFENEHNLDIPNTVIYEKEMI